ncbi:MAG: hypothetical protein IJC88_04600 [Oscillospiraceae bacterium]|nr:hypothetical protein [Oscillospiraceae bacterium]
MGEGDLTILVTIAGIALIVYGMKKKNQKIVVFSAIGLALAYVAYFCAINEIPWALRKIRGEDFIGQWMALFGILMLGSLAVTLILSLVELFVCLGAAKSKAYSSEDLMLLRKLDRYQMVGYYLLKGRLDGILQCKYSKKKGGRVELNPNWTEQVRRTYCETNPQIKQIVAYIAGASKENNEERIYATKNTKTLSAIVKKVDITSGRGRKLIVKFIRKAKPISLAVLFGLAVGGYFVGYTKLLMGLYRGKAVGGLVGTLLVLAPMFTTMCYAINRGIYDAMGFLIKRSLDRQSKRFKGVEKPFECEFDANLTDEEKAGILRAYVMSGDLKRYTNTEEDKRFLTYVLGSVVVAQAAAARAVAAAKAAARASSSGGGCSGCSSCSSCGGCGGCGD